MTSINLEKKQPIDLNKAAPSVQEFLIALGWDEGPNRDLDAQAFLLNSAGKLVADPSFVFYNNLQSPDGAVTHSGDNLTGVGAGDDETITVNLAKLDPAVEQIVFTVTIHDAKNRGQSFDQVNGAYVRIVDNSTQSEIAKYNLAGEPSAKGATALLFSRLFKNGAKWEFEAIGQGFEADLAGVLSQFR